ncbi:Uncharacterized protein TCM_019091 [Theobroma cacao]|uniref:Uncharacterized protein n=1 Tax=Theobroma cacao TaxID=3641 RepID=A0A061ENH9_THECC|nr:Uncharacterized protein TCM_019091 [Theobroma cacao]
MGKPFSAMSSARFRPITTQPASPILVGGAIFLLFNFDIIIREFYANAIEHVDGVAFIRGKQVPFHSQAINAFFRTPNIENDEYRQYLGIRIAMRLYRRFVLRKPNGRHHMGRAKRDGIGFPSLIIALCARAGVHWNDKEELQQSKIPITMGILKRLEESAPGAGSSSQAGPYLPK